MDVDGPFGERALLLFTVIGNEAISVLYKDELEFVSSPELLYVGPALRAGRYEMDNDKNTTDLFQQTYCPIINDQTSFDRLQIVTELLSIYNGSF
jgi:hypothetical protein